MPTPCRSTAAWTSARPRRRSPSAECPITASTSSIPASPTPRRSTSVMRAPPSRRSSRTGRFRWSCGGTGLYVRAASTSSSSRPANSKATPDARLRTRAQLLGAAALHAELAGSIHASAALIHPNNVRRTVRALEMLAEGRSYADQTAGFASTDRPLSRNALLRPHDGPPDALRTHRRAGRRDDRCGAAGRGRFAARSAAIGMRSRPHRRSATRSSSRLPRATCRSQRRSQADQAGVQALREAPAHLVPRGFAHDMARCHRTVA